MTRRRNRHHGKHKPKTSSNPSSGIDTKQGFLSYLSTSKGFVAASLGYLTTLSQILPTSAQSYNQCKGEWWLGTSVWDTCYTIYQMGIYGDDGQCKIDERTQWIFDELGDKLFAENACGVIRDCSNPYPMPFYQTENILISSGYLQPSQPDYEKCVENLILKLSEEYDSQNDNQSSNSWIIGYVALAIVGSCALGVGLYYAKKFINSWLEQRQQRAQVAEGSNESTYLFNRL
jgi:hypothetical protein